MRQLRRGAHLPSASHQHTVTSKTYSDRVAAPDVVEYCVDGGLGPGAQLKATTTPSRPRAVCNPGYNTTDKLSNSRLHPGVGT